MNGMKKLENTNLEKIFEYMTRESVQGVNFDKIEVMSIKATIALSSFINEGKIVLTTNIKNKITMFNIVVKYENELYQSFLKTKGVKVDEMIFEYITEDEYVADGGEEQYATYIAYGDTHDRIDFPQLIRENKHKIKSTI